MMPEFLDKKFPLQWVQCLICFNPLDANPKKGQTSSNNLSANCMMEADSVNE